MCIRDRCVDAFTDITMGHIVDTAKLAKDGKFRPWIRRMCVPVVVAGVLMFNPFIADKSMTFKMVYIYLTYLFWGSICYTGINIPYGSMASGITAEQMCIRDRPYIFSSGMPVSSDIMVCTSIGR